MWPVVQHRVQRRQVGDEWAAPLRVGVVSVGGDFDCDACLGQQPRVEVVRCSGAHTQHRRAGAAAQIDEHRGLGACGIKTAGGDELDVQSQCAGHQFDEGGVHRGQRCPRLVVDRVEVLGVGVEVLGAPVDLAQGAPVAVGPARVGDGHVPDRLRISACAADRNAESLPSAGVATDPGAMLDASFGELDVVEQHELVYVEQSGEVALPR